MTGLASEILLLDMLASDSNTMVAIKYAVGLMTRFARILIHLVNGKLKKYLWYDHSLWPSERSNGSVVICGKLAVVRVC